MTSWNDYLSSQRDCNLTLSVADLADGFAAAITSQGVIAVAGEEAASFLHKQLTNDVEHLGLDTARLAGYCSPKGRLQATFLMWRDAESVFLQLPHELQAPLQKRLSMFVMRAKAKLADATPECTIGFGGAKAQAALELLFGALPASPYSKLEHESGTLIRVADAFGASRYLWLTTSTSAQKAWPVLGTTLALGGDDGWRLSAIHAGVPEITASTQEQFVPQMVNYEILGGVNFKKGCYPGQEIVARSQYLGKLKRRTALATIAATKVQAGDEVFSIADPEQPCGMVVNAAPNGAGGVDALVEIKLAALEQGDVRLGSAEGAALRWLDMPYPLDALDL
ncbi:MAG: folate-binding protein [Pseudomonadota bacterium]